MTEDQRKYFELIQAVVSRLAGNSFSIKGWAVGLVAILGGFAAKDSDPRFAFGLWLPALCFWGLDAYYLRQERLFRALYNAATAPGSTVAVYSMNIMPYQAQIPSVIKVAFSRTILWLHMPILIFVLTLTSYSIYKLETAPHPAAPAIPAATIPPTK
jgi:hypothetical protein